MRKLPDALMLFAAGFGTRMGALTAACPKPLIKVAGKPLIDHALDIIDETDIKTVVVNTHYLPDMLQTHLKDRAVFLSHEPDILETGGGLRNALPLLGHNPVFTFNTDAIWVGQNPLDALMAAWDPEKMDALLMLVPPSAAKGYQGMGDFELTADTTIRRGAGLIYSGAQIIKTNGISDISQTKFSLNVLWDNLIDSGRVFGIQYDGSWCDVGTSTGIEVAEKMLGGVNV